MSDDLHTFSGMPGVKRRLRGPMAKSPSGFLKALRKHRIVSDAGDHGSVMAYTDDKKQIRAAFLRYHATISEDVFTSKAALRRWLVEWMPKQRVRP